MAAEGATITDDAHISFAKRLAHNNKDTRKAALKKVKRWLVTKSKQGALDHDEIIKIWKGLHYSMWYSDKPLTQESLALDISQIVSLLPDMGDAINFFGGFCETIAREWTGIDRQRLDKFYMFIKTALKCVLEFCAANDWKEEIVRNVVETLDNRIINSPCPDSISVFISEHLYTLYSEVCTDSTPPFFITELLSCYVTVLSKTPKKDLSQVLMSNLFTPITSDSVNVKIDHSRLIDHITNVAVQSGILTRNRKLLYRLRNDIATVGGVNVVISSPLGKHSIVKEGDENVPDNGISEEETVKPPKKKKKKKKKKQVVEQSETVVENGDNKTEEVSEVTDQIVDSKSSTNTDEDKCEPTQITPEDADLVSLKDNDSSVKVEEEAIVDTKVEITEPVSVEDSVAVKENIATEEVIVKEESESQKEETKPCSDDEILKEDVVTVEELESAETDVASGEKVEEEKKEEVTETESKVVVTEEAADKESKEEVVQNETLENKEDLVKQAAETEETAVLAPTESEISEEVVETEEIKSKEILSSTPATKTGKRKSTRTKKTPKKVTEAEPTPASEPTESVENEKPAEETEPEIFSLQEETTEAAPSPKQTRSMRKRKKKSICATPEVTTPSTPTVTTSTKKKVRLSMENNQTFFFKKNTSLESPKPYDSTRTPVKGVLKVSPALTRSQARKKGKSRVKP